MVFIVKVVNVLPEVGNSNMMIFIVRIYIIMQKKTRMGLFFSLHTATTKKRNAINHMS